MTISSGPYRTDVGTSSTGVGVVTDNTVRRYEGIGEWTLAFAGLVTAWSERVFCGQCGLPYDKRACGPTHALVASQVQAARDITNA